MVVHVFAGCLKYSLKCLNFLQVLQYTFLLPFFIIESCIQPLLMFSNENSLPFIHESRENGIRF